MLEPLPEIPQGHPHGYSLDLIAEKYRCLPRAESWAFLHRRVYASYIALLRSHEG